MENDFQNIPFNDFPDFSAVIDEISDDGFNFHYNSVRLLYADKGTTWKRKWEPIINRWRRMAQDWFNLITILRKNQYNDTISCQQITSQLNEPDLIDFIARAYNAFVSTDEYNSLKSALFLGSKDESTLVQRFVENVMENHEKIHSQERSLTRDQCNNLKDSVLNYLECMQQTEPIAEIGGLKVITYDHFQSCIFSIKEILESMSFQ